MAVLSWQFCPDCLDLPVLFCLSSSTCPVMAVPFWMSRSGSHVLAVLFSLSCPGSPLLVIQIYICTDDREGKLGEWKVRNTSYAGSAKAKARRPKTRVPSSALLCSPFSPLPSPLSSLPSTLLSLLPSTLSSLLSPLSPLRSLSPLSPLSAPYPSSFLNKQRTEVTERHTSAVTAYFRF
jgi:hypothetical protein